MPVATVNTTQYLDNGYITIEWNSLTIPGGGEYILERKVGSGAVEILYQGALKTYTDWYAPAATQIIYEVKRTNAATDGPQTIGPLTLDSYWLLHPTTSSFHVGMKHVVTDSFSDEGEEAVLNVIGRGRHVDYGTDFGETGTLSAHLRQIGSVDPRLTLLQLKALKAEKTWVWLRNPFGDIWKVSIGQIQVNRISGVGSREDVDVTIPYYEVA